MCLAAICYDKFMSVGVDGEKIAAEYLRNKGYKILKTNYHSRFGEIDIIAKDKETYVFVEVKTRSNRLFGTPLEAITRHKLFKIIKTLEFYLFENKLQNKDYRIDAVEVMLENGKTKIEQLKNISL